LASWPKKFKDKVEVKEGSCPPGIEIRHSGLDPESRNYLAQNRMKSVMGTGYSVLGTGGKKKCNHPASLLAMQGTAENTEIAEKIIYRTRTQSGVYRTVLVLVLESIFLITDRSDIIRLTVKNPEFRSWLKIR